LTHEHRSSVRHRRRRRAGDGGGFRTRRAVACAALLAAITSGCAQAPAAPPASAARGAAADVAPTHTVTYALAWAPDDVVPAADGVGFMVTNDLGYTVHVERGWLTSYGVELVECPRASAPSPVARGGALLWSLVEGTAFAGHATDTPNPAAIRPMQVESLTAAHAIDVATLELAPQEYCKLHYLLARAGADARGLPSETDLVGTSLDVEGTYRAPGATSDVPFTLRTASAYGALLEQAADDARPLRVDTAHAATRVTVRRHRAHLFDGVDFARMPERAAALQVLRATAEHADVEITTTQDAGGA
jgi:hypothetical protein